MLDPRLLASFREVAVRRSFSAAADALGFTQPAISQHVSRLEKTVGAKLLERDARGVTPTIAGETLLRGADQVLEQLRRLETDVREAAGHAPPALRVAAFPSVASGLLPGAVAELRARHPHDAKLELSVIDPEPALERLAAGTIDVAMVIDSAVAPLKVADGLELVPILVEPMLVAFGAGHHLASRASIALEELRDEPWLLTAMGGTCEDSSIVLRAFHEAGFTPDIRLESEDYNALQGMAAAGMGVAMIPSLCTVNTRSDVVIRPLRGQPPVRHILAAVRAGERPPMVDHFLDGLRIAAEAVPSAAPRLHAVA